MSVGAQEVGEQVRIAEVGLTLGSGVPRPRCLDHVGVDRHDEPAFDERVDDETRSGRSMATRLGRRCDLAEPCDQLRHPGRACARR